MSVNEIKEFIFENYYKRIGFSKQNIYYSRKCLKIKNLLLFANKIIAKIPDLHNAKEKYKSIKRKKNRKTMKNNYLTTTNN